MKNTQAHYAIIQGGKITNVVEWDGKSEYNPGGDLIKITGLSPEPGIGWDYVDGKFVDNRPQDDDEF
jgi:hypothetical protein